MSDAAVTYFRRFTLGASVSSACAVARSISRTVTGR